MPSGGGNGVKPSGDDVIERRGLSEGDGNFVPEESQNREDIKISRHTEEQHSQSAECWLKTQAVCKTFQPNVDTFNANVVIGNEESQKRKDIKISCHTERKRKYPVTNLKELLCKEGNYIEINNQLDCFGSKEPHNDDNSSYLRHSECNEESQNREDFTNNAILRGLNNYSPQNDCKIAFTLAEVLITLGIIGVVAVLTLSAMKNVRNYQLKESFKVAYSIMSQAINKVSIEEGGNLQKNNVVYVASSEQCPRGCYPFQDILADKIYSEMKVIGTCKYKKIYNFSKTTDNPYIDWGTASPKKALANGMCFEVTINGAQINLTIDINGLKKPNILGYDIFQFKVGADDKVVPKKMTKLYTNEELEEIENRLDYAYSAQMGEPCSNKSSQRGNGLGCAYYALIDQNPDDSTKGYWESLP